MTGTWYKCDECGRETKHPSGWQTLAPPPTHNGQEACSRIYTIGDRPPGSPYHFCSWACMAKHVAKQED